MHRRTFFAALVAWLGTLLFGRKAEAASAPQTGLLRFYREMTTAEMSKEGLSSPFQSLRGSYVPVDGTQIKKGWRLLLHGSDPADGAPVAYVCEAAADADLETQRVAIASIGYDLIYHYHAERAVHESLTHERLVEQFKQYAAKHGHEPLVALMSPRTYAALLTVHYGCAVVGRAQLTHVLGSVIYFDYRQCPVDGIRFTGGDEITHIWTVAEKAGKAST